MKWLLTLIFALNCFGATVTPYDYLASQTKPIFKSNTSFPKLGNFGWPEFSLALRTEVATNWGYYIQFGSYNSLNNGGVETDLTNTVGSNIVALCKAYPSIYKLQIITDKALSTNLSTGFYVTNAAGQFVDNNTNLWTGSPTTPYHAITSPEGSDADWNLQASYIARAVATLQSNVDISLIMDGGEWGLGVPGYDRKSWQFDPRCISAMATNGLSWNRYSSTRKAHQQGIIASAVRSATPHRQMYVFYKTDYEKTRFVQPGYDPWEDTFGQWGWASDLMNPVTDLPSLEDYYTGDGSFTNATGINWNDVTDLLTFHLNSKGFNIGLGKPYDYSWVSGGWPSTDTGWVTNTSRLADIPKYTGLLKCLYTAGTVGAVAGQFTYQNGTFNAIFDSSSPPHWIPQIQSLAHVHALFTWLDSFVYSSDLLPGPTNHLWSTDQPAYEFPTGYAHDRVLARKYQNRDQWIVTAWAADGVDRDVTVTLPTAGALTVNARAAGSVYFVRKDGATVTQTLIDVNGTTPTIGMNLPQWDTSIILRVKP